MLISNPGIQPMHAGWNVHATDNLINVDYIPYDSRADCWYDVTVVDRSTLIWSEPDFCSLGGKPL